MRRTSRLVIALGAAAALLSPAAGPMAPVSPRGVSLQAGRPGDAGSEPSTPQPEPGRWGQGGPGGDRGDGGPYVSDVPTSSGSVILCRPTDRSVVVSVLMSRTARVRVRYGPHGAPGTQTGIVQLAAGEPQEVPLSGLRADTAYDYRVVDAATGQGLLPEAGSGTFRTQRSPGSEFVFAVQADSHLDGQCTADLYRRTLSHVAAEHPDFLVDLGDTFMTGKIRDRDRALRQYLVQRHYLSLVGASAPVFLAIGNHDGEEVFRPDAAGPDGLAVWACAQRKRCFPGPVPDAFYSGDAAPQAYAGPLQDYYAWTWGDALFVVLDPYWYSSGTRGGRDGWGMTLGKAQYDWLARTLRASKARWKLVFIHQLVGGLDNGGRGGAEAAALCEWGGHEKDGSDTFAAHRPGWAKPVHALLVDAGVNIVFHGHDHFFARQERDGVTYQLAPQPANRNFRRHQAEEYGYLRGDFLPSSGHLRVRVSPQRIRVDYVRTADEEMQSRGIADGASAFTYECTARQMPTGRE